jgi:ClpP class serine protease
MTYQEKSDVIAKYQESISIYEKEPTQENFERKQYFYAKVLEERKILLDKNVEAVKELVAEKQQTIQERKVFAISQFRESIRKLHKETKELCQDILELKREANNYRMK